MKRVKRRMFFSLFCMLVCVSMLIGTTLAWFTDQASSDVNKIVAGNLDVDLVMWNGTEYVSIAGEDGAIFGCENSLVAQNDSTDTLWEPGKTQIVYLGVRNKGNLALKYNIIINVIDGGLVGALEYAILDGVDASAPGFTPPASWEAIKSTHGVQTGDVVAGIIVAASDGVLDGIAQNPPVQDETDYFALAVHMKEDAGNQYMGKDITIDVSVFAGQMTAESDSFDNQYDKDAELQFIAVTPHDIDKKLMNLKSNMILFLQPGDYGIIDLTKGLKDGDKLENVVVLGSPGVVVNRILVGSDASKSVTIDNLTISNLTVHNRTSGQWNIRFDNADKNTYKKLIIENCTFTASNGSLGAGIGLDNEKTDSDVSIFTADVVIRNCTFNEVSSPVYALNYCWNSITVENCVFNKIPNSAIYNISKSTIKSIVVTGCTFIDCGSYLLRPCNGNNLPELTEFVFKDNTVYNCTGGYTGYFHMAIPSSVKKVENLTGNTKDGLDWDVYNLISTF